MRTKTRPKVEAIVDQVTSRLSSIGTALSTERGKLAELQRRRLRASITGDDGGDLVLLDSQITAAERNVQDLVQLREAEEPMVLAITSAKERVARLEKDLVERRAQAEAWAAFAKLQTALLDEILPIVEEAIDVHKHVPPSIADLHKQLTGRWSPGGSIGAHLDRARDHGFEAGISETERSLATARRRLSELCVEVSGR